MYTFYRKNRPSVILETESNELKTLTRQIADSLTPPNTPNESNNIEQELIDVLRGHRVITKNQRQINDQLKFSEVKQDTQYERTSTKRRTRTASNVDIEKTTETFSYV